MSNISVAGYIVRQSITSADALSLMFLTDHASYDFVDRMVLTTYCAETGQEIVLTYCGPHDSEDLLTFEPLKLTDQLLILHQLEGTALYSAKIESNVPESFPLLLLPQRPNLQEQYRWPCEIRLSIQSARQMPDVNMYLAWEAFAENSSSALASLFPASTALKSNDRVTALEHVANHIPIEQGMFLPCEIEVSGRHIHCALVLSERNNGTFRATLFSSQPLTLKVGMEVRRSVRCQSERFTFEDTAIIGVIQACDFSSVIVP